MPEQRTPERPVAERAAYSARPTVLVDGQRDDALMSMLRACVVREAEGGLSSLALTLSNWGLSDAGLGYVFDAGGTLALGTRLKLYVGESTAPRALFEGTVHAIEARADQGAPPELSVLAEDALYAALLARRSALYADCTPADVVRRVAERLGLAHDVGDLGDTRANWAQLNESDLAFVRRLLARCDADLQISADTLQVRRAADRERGTLDLTLYSQLTRARVVADLSSQTTQTTSAGFDLLNGRAVAASSRGAAAGPGSGRSGAELLQRLQARSEHLAPLACDNADEAQALADAAFDQRARRFVRAHGSAEGNAELRVGSQVRLHGLGRRFDNSYAVIEATHRWDAISGYQTDFVAQSAYLAEA